MREARCPRCGWLFHLEVGEGEGALCCHCKKDAAYEAQYGPNWRTELARQITQTQEPKPL